MSNAIIHTPHEVAQAGYKSIKGAVERGGAGIPLKVSGSDIDEYFAPLLEWEVCAIQAQTHNGKTYFSNWWERETAKYLAENDLQGDIVHVSLEESLEAMAIAEYGRLLDILPSKLARGEFKELKKLEIAMTKIANSRIWRIADFGGNDDEIELTLSNIKRALKAMNEGLIADKKKIRLITIDYLQALPIDSETKKANQEDQRRLQVRNDVYAIRNMAKNMLTPILVPLQCKQTLSHPRLPYMIPSMYDGEETSAIAQRFDRIISLWMPKNDYPVGVPVYSGKDGNKVLEFTPSENQVYLKVNKQRGGLPSSKVFELQIDFSTHEYIGKYGRAVKDKK